MSGRKSRSRGIALVGCGYWGRNLARNLHQMGHLVSVCDRDPKVLRGLRAAHHGVRTIRSFQRALDDPRATALALAAPAAQHYVLARECLLAGKDVFVEKPLALRVPEAEELVALAEERKRVLMVGHLLEYHPAVRKLEEFVNTGDLGRCTTSTPTGSTWGRSGRRRTSCGASRRTTSP